jgi:hypothetical protein
MCPVVNLPAFKTEKEAGKYNDRWCAGHISAPPVPCHSCGHFHHGYKRQPEGFTPATPPSKPFKRPGPFKRK